MPPAIKVAANAGTARIVSPFAPTQTRTIAATAEARNGHILTLCDTVLIAHTSPRGKTEALTREALSVGHQLYAFSSPSNARLFEFGALPLDESL